MILGYLSSLETAAGYLLVLGQLIYTVPRQLPVVILGVLESGDVD